MLRQGPVGAPNLPHMPCCQHFGGKPPQGRGEGGQWPRSRDTWPASGTVRGECG